MGTVDLEERNGVVMVKINDNFYASFRMEVFAQLLQEGLKLLENKTVNNPA